VASVCCEAATLVALVEGLVLILAFVVAPLTAVLVVVASFLVAVAAFTMGFAMTFVVPGVSLVDQYHCPLASAQT